MGLKKVYFILMILFFSYCLNTFQTLYDWLTPYLTKINLTDQNFTTEIESIFPKMFQYTLNQSVLCQRASCLSCPPAGCIPAMLGDSAPRTRRLSRLDPLHTSVRYLSSSSHPGQLSLLANNQVHRMTHINCLTLQIS